MTKQWKLMVHGSAERDLNWLKTNAPDAFNAIITEMKKMAEMDDPRKHKHVKAIQYDAPGWYRVALYTHHIRVVFRLIQEVNGSIVEIQEIQGDGDKAIQITRAGFRNCRTYGEELTQRYNRVKETTE